MMLTEFYLARPYNFNLSPLAIDKRLNLDRQFAFSSSACTFLKEHKFDFGQVFSTGVPYLSREEEQEVREQLAKREAQNAAKSDIIMSPTDREALEFYRGARKKILAWTNDPKVLFYSRTIASVLTPVA